MIINGSTVLRKLEFLLFVKCKRFKDLFCNNNILFLYRRIYTMIKNCIIFYKNFSHNYL